MKSAKEIVQNLSQEDIVMFSATFVVLVFSVIYLIVQ